MTKGVYQSVDNFYDLDQLKVDSELLRLNMLRLETIYIRMSNILKIKNINITFMNDLDEIGTMLSKMGMKLEEIVAEIQLCIDRDENFPWE